MKSRCIRDYDSKDCFDESDEKDSVKEQLYYA